MANELVVYTIVHQPRRIRLPARPLPDKPTIDDFEQCLFDDEMNKFYFTKVAKYCYYPATEMFLDLVKAGLKLSIAFSVSFLKQAQNWDPKLLDLFRELVKHPNVELVCSEPYHSFIPLLDLPLFSERMAWARQYLEDVFGVSPQVTDTTEMLMSEDIYFALNNAGFTGAVMDGRPWVMEWRESTHLYHYGRDLRLLTRHYELSDDVGYRFSNKEWAEFPLHANKYAQWLRQVWGDFVFIGWDYETFGEHHSRDTGIFDFMRWLPDEVMKRGMTCLTPSEAIAKYKDNSFYLPLPTFPTTWAGTGGVEFFLGNPAQQAIFQLMLRAYNKARLTKNDQLIDLALWLTQSDNLHLIQWFGRSDSQAEVSAYFTPREWWRLGADKILWEQQAVYRNFIWAMDKYL
jgi:alpha-amylase